MVVVERALQHVYSGHTQAIKKCTMPCVQRSGVIVEIKKKGRKKYFKLCTLTHKEKQSTVNALRLQQCPGTVHYTTSNSLKVLAPVTSTIMSRCEYGP